MMLKQKQLQVQIAKVTARKLEMECSIYEYEEKIEAIKKEVDNQEQTIKKLEQELKDLQGE